MNKRLILSLAALCLVLAFACKKEETATTDSSTTSSTISTTDTSSTTTAPDTSGTSTADTSGTTATGTTSTTSTGSSGGTISSLNEDDKKFAIAAAQAGMAEVNLGLLASQNGVDAGVKSFGQQMVTDHGKANDQLKLLATNKGLALPTDIGKEHQAVADKLSKKSGHDFDKAYADAMVDGHTKVAAAFEKESQSGTDPDLKSFAAQTLPTIQGHLKMAQDLKTKLK